MARGELPKTIPIQISLGEGLDVGEDVGSAVDFTYTPPFAFTGGNRAGDGGAALGVRAMRQPSAILAAAVLAGAVASAAPAQEPPEPARPNILFILMDNLGYGEVGRLRRRHHRAARRRRGSTAGGRRACG